MIKSIPIKEICDIKFGLYVNSQQEEAEGTAAYLQVKQFDEDGIVREQTDEYVLIDNKSAPHLLAEGDVLFVGKGNRLFAWCYSYNEGKAIASSVFFVLRPFKSMIDPAYLTAILNAPQIKAAFKQLGAGTSIFSIRKSELGAFNIPLPNMELQRRIANYASNHKEEILLYKQIIEKKHDQYSTVIAKFIQ